MGIMGINPIRGDVDVEAIPKSQLNVKYKLIVYSHNRGGFLGEVHFFDDNELFFFAVNSKNHPTYEEVIVELLSIIKGT